MNTKKLFKIFCLLLAAVFLLSACANTAANQTDDLPEIIVGTDSYEPYSDLSTVMGPVAVDVELATEAFRRMGYQVVFSMVDWEDADEALANGEVDCMWACITMEGKEDRFQWAGPYLYANEVVVVRADGDIQTLADLAGKRIAVHAESMTETVLLEEQNPEIPSIGALYSFGTMTEVRTSLSKGYSDAIVGYEGEMTALIESSPEEFRMLDETVSTHKLGVAFAKDYDASFVAELKKVLEQMQLDGTTAKIVEKYGLNVEKALGEK